MNTVTHLPEWFPAYVCINLVIMILLHAATGFANLFSDESRFIGSLFTFILACMLTTAFPLITIGFIVAMIFSIKKRIVHT